MNEQTVVDIGARTIWVAIQLAGPALLAVLITGIIISIFQAATQIHEQTLSFIPKILAMTAALVIFGPWSIRLLMEFTTSIIKEIPESIHHDF
jgi:flagellar biosynthetic protein FliQ